MNQTSKVAILLEAVPDLAGITISRLRGEVIEEAPRKLSTDDKPMLELVSKLKGVTALTVSKAEDSKILREALAKGIDSGICLCHNDARSFDKLTIAKGIAKLVVQRGFSTIIARNGVIGNLLRWLLNYNIAKLSNLQTLSSGTIVLIDTTVDYKMPSAIFLAKAVGKPVEMVDFLTLGVAVPGQTTATLSKTIL